MPTDSFLIEGEPSTSASLLENACQGDSLSWERIVHLYGPILYTWARRSGCQPADAADIVQEVLADAFRNLNSFQPRAAGSTFRGWLWTITRRRLIDQYRARAARPAAALEAIGEVAADARPESYPDEPPTDDRCDRQLIIAAALSSIQRRFAPQTVEAFRRTVLDGQDPGDVAAALGMTRWGVYKARGRILQRLREELDGLGW